jgi:bifunctional non-homologous end joining protein LigD
MRPYDRKRNFSVTPEPSFDAPATVEADALRFVIQRHDASRLHFDLRLELDGALKSWAVPKGPSLDPKAKRAAIMVEDHPLDYANFEGQIPKGEYGGGEVLIWDEGTYLPAEGTGDRATDEALVRQGLAEGKLSFFLRGHRLRGEFTLVRKDDTADWLLLKKADAEATERDPTEEATSIRTALTSEEVAQGRRGIEGAKPAPMPETLEAMIPGEAPEPFKRDGWSFEPKLDGIRVLAFKRGGEVRLVTRNGNEVADRFPRVVAALRELPDRELILDGELVLTDAAGKASFQLLMEVYQRTRPDIGVVFWPFDVLFRNGEDLCGAVLDIRKAQLPLLGLRDPLRPMLSFGSDGVALFEQVRKLGMEGIVGKRRQSRYRGGVQPDDWLKIKGYHTEEFVVGGYTVGTGARERSFGALLLGRRDGLGKLSYCGNVGSGFSDAQLVELRKELDARETGENPFNGPLDLRGKVVFVRPELIAEVRFMTWTTERRLRFPVFQRMRPDVPVPHVAPASDVVPESDFATQLEKAKGDWTTEVDGHSLRFTSLDKPLWPGTTKRDLIRYFVRIAPHFLRHFRNRPLTFVRFPDGIDGESFYQRHYDKNLPDFVERVDVFSEHNEGARQLLLINNLPTMLWLAQIAAIELHPWHASVTLGEDMTTEEAFAASALNHPDYLVCDLDPNIRSGKEKEGAEPELNDLGWSRTVEAAFALRELLGTLRLRGYPKTSGKTGLHVYIPLERIYDHAQVREAARTFAAFMERKYPKLITIEYRLAKRPDKVFFDAGMNGKTKTLAGAYSPRPVADARVSMPLTWEQLASARPEMFTIATVPDLLAARGDAWQDFGEDRQRLG